MQKKSLLFGFCVLVHVKWILVRARVQGVSSLYLCVLVFFFSGMPSSCLIKVALTMYFGTIQSQKGLEVRGTRW